MGESYKGKIYARCKLVGSIAEAGLFLSEQYKSEHPEMLSKWPKVLPVKDFEEFNSDCFIPYLEYELGYAVSLWRGKLMRIDTEYKDLSEALTSKFLS